MQLYKHINSFNELCIKNKKKNKNVTATRTTGENKILFPLRYVAR